MKLTIKKALLTFACTLVLPLSVSANETEVTKSITKSIEKSPTENSSTEKLTIERIFSSPSLNGQTPKSLKFSPDGNRVTRVGSRISDK